MNVNGSAASAAMFTLGATEFISPLLPTPKPRNTRTQKTVRREVRRRINLPRAIQKRLGFKCH